MFLECFSRFLCLFSLLTPHCQVTRLEKEVTDQQAAELDKLKLAAEAQVNSAPVRGLGTGVQDMAP